MEIFRNQMENITNLTNVSEKCNKNLTENYLTTTQKYDNMYMSKDNNNKLLPTRKEAERNGNENAEIP